MLSSLFVIEESLLKVLKRLFLRFSKILFSVSSLAEKEKQRYISRYLLIARLEEIHIRTTSRTSLRNTILQSSRLYSKSRRKRTSIRCIIWRCSRSLSAFIVPRRETKVLSTTVTWSILRQISSRMKRRERYSVNGLNLYLLMNIRM